MRWSELPQGRLGLANDCASEEVHAVLSPVELAGIDKARDAKDPVAFCRKAPALRHLCAKRLGMAGSQDRIGVQTGPTSRVGDDFVLPQIRDRETRNPLDRTALVRRQAAAGRILVLEGIMLLDHLILPVNHVGETSQFFTEILGLAQDEERPPFTVMRVTPEFTIQLAPWGTNGGEHLAFAMPREEFDVIFARVREAGIEFGDSFDSVGNMKGPGQEGGARGLGASLYFFDPNKHLIEIRHYDDSRA